MYAHDQSKKCRWILSYIQPSPLCRELARWPLRARAGDQRLRRAAREPVAGLPGATGAASGVGGTAHAPLGARPGGAWRTIWRARCRRWPVIRRTGRQPPWRGWDRRSWHETPDFPGVHEMRRNFPRVKSYLQQPALTGRRRKEDAHEQKRLRELASRTQRAEGSR